MRPSILTALVLTTSAQAQFIVTVCEKYSYTTTSTFTEYETFYVVDGRDGARTITPTFQNTGKSIETTTIGSSSISSGVINGGIGNSRMTFSPTTQISISENVPGNGTAVVIPDNTIAPSSPIPTSLIGISFTASGPDISSSVTSNDSSPVDPRTLKTTQSSTSSTSMRSRRSSSARTNPKTTTRSTTKSSTVTRTSTTSQSKASTTTRKITSSTKSTSASSSSSTRTITIPTSKSTTPASSITLSSTSTSTSKASTPSSKPSSTSTSIYTSTTPVVTNQAYIDTILRHHNRHRLNHTSDALSWNSTLADTAKKIANSCVYKHDTATDCPPGGPSCYGQNIAAGYLSTQMSFLVSDGFYNSEVNSYTYYGGEPAIDTLHEWGHFSQIVWKIDTFSVGCYTMDCSGRNGGLVFPGGGGEDILPVFTVCNYGGPGNWVGEFKENVIKPIGLPSIHAGYMCPTLDNCEDGATV